MCLARRAIEYPRLSTLSHYLFGGRTFLSALILVLVFGRTGMSAPRSRQSDAGPGLSEAGYRRMSTLFYASSSRALPAARTWRMRQTLRYSQ